MQQGFRNYNFFYKKFQPIVASGGSVSDVTINGTLYRVHTFTSTGSSTFSVSSVGNGSNPKVEYLVVAGGGAGGYPSDRTGGGGGAGGLLHNIGAGISVSATSYPLSIGAGGTGGVVPTNGQNSTAFGVTAIGGGRGGGSAYLSATGGSSGGTYHNAADTVKSGTSGQGTSGGAGYDSGNVSVGFKAGGGGGSFSAGSSASSGINGNGGSGTPLKMASNTATYYAAGGGGGNQVYTAQSLGGNGGGGNGAVNSTTAATAGAANTGSGGGGGAVSNGGSSFLAGANGGSGIIIIRYPLEMTGIPINTSNVGIVATGGNISYDFVSGTTYKIHTFRSSDTFSVSSLGSLGGQIEYLIAAGGGGGADRGGGGGGGGVITNFGGTKLSVSVQNYSISVGSGGLGGREYWQMNSAGTSYAPTGARDAATNGQNSTAFGLTAIGGGAGAEGYSGGSAAGQNGGSGGGGVLYGNPNVTVSKSGYTAGQGNAGGGALFIASTTTRGGGGGAGSAGTDGGAGGVVNAIGGDGLLSSISGSQTYYGGGGSACYSTLVSLGGTNGDSMPQANAVSNSGAGGGGQYGFSNYNSAPNSLFWAGGGNGGSGVVIIRYPISTS